MNMNEIKKLRNADLSEIYNFFCLRSTEKNIIMPYR